MFDLLNGIVAIVFFAVMAGAIWYENHKNKKHKESWRDYKW